MEWTRLIRGSGSLASRWSQRFIATLSTPGLLVATLFFAASLTPSLLPRTLTTQGILSGVSIGVGYGVGVFGRWLWGYLGLPVPRPRTQQWLVLGAAGVAVVVAVIFLRQAAEWQNSIRTLMELEPVDSAQPIRVGALASMIGILLIALGRLFGLTVRTFQRWLDAPLPQRIANVTGAALAIVLFWTVINGVLFERAIRVMDASFQQVDARIEPDLSPPRGALRTGSSASLLDWADLGRRGREFVSSGPDADAIRPRVPPRMRDDVLDPIRVYVGLNSARSIAERAELALQELIRTGAFDRSMLVIATPTGTGWVDPKGIEPIEYLQRGDLATVAVQYSYLASWLSLLVEPEYGEETAREVFGTIYDYWTRLPEDARPDLYLYGLSLGALNSQRSADLYDVIGDPYAGALWAGPPFRSTSWRAITDERRPGSPAWLPRFRDGSVVRFTNQERRWPELADGWGPLRLVYLQYASDPVTFFETASLYRPPAWLSEPRGPDVSDELRWYPVVTMLQLAVDVAAGDGAPIGHGHVYAPEHYLEAWIGVRGRAGWQASELTELRSWFEDRPLPREFFRGGTGEA